MKTPLELINPKCDEIPEFDVKTWNPLLAAHINRSSQVFVSPEKQYLCKVKDRKPYKSKKEFLNLAMWETILGEYSKQHNGLITVPRPIKVDMTGIIISYMRGVELDRISSSETFTEENMTKVAYIIGQFRKIQESEGLYHNDAHPRHFLINDGVTLIDLENAGVGLFEEAKYESENLNRILLKASGNKLEKIVEEGFSSITPLNIGSDVKELINNRYSDKD